MSKFSDLLDIFINNDFPLKWEKNANFYRVSSYETKTSERNIALTGTYGRGHTPEEALENLVKELKGLTLVEKIWIKNEVSEDEYKPKFYKFPEVVFIKQ